MLIIWKETLEHEDPSKIEFTNPFGPVLAEEPFIIVGAFSTLRVDIVNDSLVDDLKPSGS